MTRSVAHPAETLRTVWLKLSFVADARKAAHNNTAAKGAHAMKAKICNQGIEAYGTGLA